MCHRLPLLVGEGTASLWKVVQLPVRTMGRMVVMLKRLLMPGKSISVLTPLYMSGTWEKKPLTTSGVREVERPQPKSLCEGPAVTVVTTGDTPRADRGRAGALLPPTPGTMSSRSLGKPAEMSKPPGTTDAATT